MDDEWSRSFQAIFQDLEGASVNSNFDFHLYANLASIVLALATVVNHVQ